MKFSLRKFIFALPLLFLPTLVSAHATPIIYTPESGSILQEPLKTVSIKFSERIDAAASDIAVFDPGGNQIDNNQPTVDPTDGHIYTVAINANESGTYTVSWQVVSADDGHFTKGGYNFSILAASFSAIAAQDTQVVFLSKTNEGWATAIELIGQGLLWGVLFILIFFGRRLILDEETKRKFRKNFNLLIIIGALSIVIGTAVYLVIKSIDLAELRAITFWPSLELFLATSAGKLALYRVVLSIVFLALYWLLKNRIFNAVKFGPGESILILILLLLALARVTASHAVAAHFLPGLTILDHLIHMIFKGLWVGVVLSFSVLLLPIVLRIKELNIVFPLLNRMSRFLAIIFAVVGITGAYIVWLDLKTPDNILATDWGQRFILLSIFGALLFLARLFNHLYIEKNLLKAGIENNQNLFARATSALKVSYPTEAILGAALLVATGFIMITTPPVWNKNIFHQQFNSQGVKIEVLEHLYETNYLQVVGSERIKNLVLTLTNEEKGIGPIVAEGERRTDNSFAISKNQFSPHGLWKIDVTAQKATGYDAVGSFSLNFPSDVDAGRLEQNQRTFGVFELMMIVNAAGILVSLVLLLMVSPYFAKKFAADVAPKNLKIEQNPQSAKHIEGLLISFLVLVALWFYVPNLSKGSFQRACEKDGNFWHSMPPTRGSKPVAQNSVYGCMLGTGQFHIADEGEYKYFTRPIAPSADLIFSPSPPVAGENSNIVIQIKDEKGEPLTNLALAHERILHTIIIAENFGSFAHAHPEGDGPITADMKANAAFPINYNFPAAGKYLIAVGFAVNAQSFSKTFLADVSGVPVMPAKAAADYNQTKIFGDYSVNFKAREGIARVNRPITLDYTVSKNNKIVTNLSPYLGAPMHLAIVKEDLSQFIHTHGEVHLPGQTSSTMMLGHFHPPPPSSFGPFVEAHVIFPEAGVYRIFGEFLHEGKVVTTNFALEVE